MFVTGLMEVLFGGAMLSMLADLAARRRGRLRPALVGAVASATVLVSFGLMVSQWAPVLGAPVGAAFAFVTRPASSPLASVYGADRLSVFMMLSSMVVIGMVTVYSWKKLGPGDSAGPHFALLLLLLCSIVGVSSAGDFVTFFLFWEAMSLAAYGLVALKKDRPLAPEAALKYFVMAGMGSLLALLGMALVYQVSGTVLLAGVLAAGGSQLGVLGLVLLVLGFGVEAAVVPLHTWLPDVYSAAPGPVAAGVGGIVTATGVFAIVKVVQPLAYGSGGAQGLWGFQAALVCLALATMLLGNLGGLAQGNLKRLLGYSSIAQTGYMLAALSTLSPLGIVAVMFTIWNHGLLKSGFFMLAGVDDATYEATDLASLEGAGRDDRRLGLAYASSVLGMVGSPPFGLFWSEIFVVQALLAAGSAVFFWLAVAVVLNVVLSIGYYFPVINRVVFGAARPGRPRATSFELAVPGALLALSLLTGLLPALFVGLLG
jgi:proton-translocating NADH-quinone oxidoreductase chain N